MDVILGLENEKKTITWGKDGIHLVGSHDNRGTTIELDCFLVLTVVRRRSRTPCACPYVSTTQAYARVQGNASTRSKVHDGGQTCSRHEYKAW